ncbi:MAG: elongation factor P [Candidatus Omnitrophica bacterium]|nr:elongation factor P [Candidatus Omnitrophota bacterium]
MISTDEFKNGMTIKLDNELYTIIEFQHVKPGKGGAFVRTKLKNFKQKTVIERTFRAGEKIEEAFIEERILQFLYKSGTTYHFMDHETYEEIVLDERDLGESIKFLKDNLEVSGRFYEGRLLEVNVPIFVMLKVEYTEPGLKGDSAKSNSKSAVLETGATILVPLFIKSGDMIKVDTRTGEYVSRC